MCEKRSVVTELGRPRAEDSPASPSCLTTGSPIGTSPRLTRPDCADDYPIAVMLVSNIPGNDGMAHPRTQFRKLLPVSQTVLATICGGWGLWLRNSVLSRPFWGNSTGWDSTLRFHYRPWPFKFAAILNMPAFLASGLLSAPLDYFRPGLPEWVSALPVLLIIPLLWYLVGAWADKNINFGKSVNTERERLDCTPIFCSSLCSGVINSRPCCWCIRATSCLVLKFGWLWPSA
jgi:hypothetical protein